MPNGSIVGVDMFTSRVDAGCMTFVVGPLEPYHPASFRQRVRLRWDRVVYWRVHRELQRQAYARAAERARASQT